MNKTTINPSETHTSLYKYMGEHINELTPYLIKNIEAKRFLNSNKTNDTHIVAYALISLNSFVLYNLVELASIFRASLRGRSYQEKRFNLKHNNSTILEAYKHLYGYGKGKKKSLWKLDIKPTYKHITEKRLLGDLISLEEKIKDFGDSKITSKDDRDLSTHYDLEPIRVYEMLVELDEEKEAQRLVSFFNLLVEISFICSKYKSKYEKFITKTFSEEISVKHCSNRLSFINSDLKVFFDTSKDAIRSNSTNIERIVKRQKVLQQLYGNTSLIDKTSISYLSRVIDLNKVTLAMLFYYVDLASTVTSVLSAEYFLEKQMILKRLNSIRYESVNKIINLTEESKDSFWTLSILPLKEKFNSNEIAEKFKKLNRELYKLRAKISLDKEERNLSVHLDEGIENVYAFIVNLDFEQEVRKSLEVLNFTISLFSFLDMGVKLMMADLQLKGDENEAHLNNKVNQIINIIEMLPEQEKYKALKEQLENIKPENLLKNLIDKY